MRRKRKFPTIFFILSITFAILSMPSSGALSTGRLERGTSARVVGDNNGALKLEGFQNKIYNMNNKYANFGIITNNTNQIMKLTVTIDPEITWLNALSTFGVKIGNQEKEFRYGSDSPKQIMITINPGQTVIAQATLEHNLTNIRTYFQFTAANPDGSYSMLLTDSTNTPRNITCY